MCLTGYMYKSSSEIASVLENPRTGPTATLSSELARRCACWVVAGYPEKSQVSAGMDTTEDDDVEDDDDDGETTEQTAGVARQGGQTGSTIGDREEEEIVAYNSAVVVSPQGTVYDTYRKSFLFDTDKTWAKEGESIITSSSSERPSYRSKIRADGTGFLVDR
jgi:protein N-terminal amidase